MKTLLTFAAVLCCAAVPAYSADGQISQSSLTKLGLSGLTPLSDVKGLEIRGLGMLEVLDLEMPYGYVDQQGDHKRDEHKRDKDRRDEYRRDEYGHDEYRHHEHKPPENHEHIFKCDSHAKPHCDFGSLCHTHCGKAG
jgi:hypothetical protein